MRLIDADAIAPKLEGKFNQDYVRYAPTIDAVPVVRWIPVTERLPEKQADVVAMSNKNGGYMFVGYRGYISGEWMENGIMHIGDVTHWMPLPEPPKEVE